MSCHRFVSSPLLHTSSLPSPFLPFPCIHPSLDPLVRHALLTDVRCMGQNPGKPLPSRSSSPLGKSGEKAHCGDFLKQKFSLDSLYKGAFGVCVSEAGARFSKEKSLSSLLCYRLLPGGPCRTTAAQPPLLPVPEAAVLAETHQCWLWNDGPEGGHELSWALPWWSQEDLEQSCRSEASLKWRRNSGLLPFRGN